MISQGRCPQPQVKSQARHGIPITRYRQDWPSSGPVLLSLAESPAPTDELGQGWVWRIKGMPAI